MKIKNTSIKSKKEIQAVFNEGRLLKVKGLKVFYKENNLPYSRILVTFPRIFKGAVERNRVKRLVKECFRNELFFKANFDFAFVLYPEIKGSTYVYVKTLLSEMLLV